MRVRQSHGKAGRADLPKAAVDESKADRELFLKLADEWRRETRHLSSDHQIAAHPAYQRIIGMGEKALPFILLQLQTRLDHWFWALTAITGESPVPREEVGRLPLMRERWLDWGRKRGLIT